MEDVKIESWQWKLIEIVPTNGIHRKRMKELQKGKKNGKKHKRYIFTIVLGSCKTVVSFIPSPIGIKSEPGKSV